MKTKNILLLTATIAPKPGVPNLKRTDPKSRLQDYERSLQFYLSMLNKGCDAIIFAENSNSDISILKKVVEDCQLSDQVEFLSFDGLDYPPHYDRGYGEFRLIDYAMENSKILLKLNFEKNERVVIWKVTGRYVIKNLQKIMARQPKRFDIYCNCRNHPKHWVDTFLIAWTPEAYQICLKGVYDRLKLNVSGVPPKAAAEELLRDWLDQQSNIQMVRRFRTTPYIDGIRGADNKGYSTDHRWKTQVRSAINTFFPWIWI